MSRLLLLGAMIALFLGMTFGTPPPAFAQSTTLVSNLDRLSTLKPAAGIYAQGFRTGAHTAGYTIRNVQVRLAAGSVTSSMKTSVLIRQERNGEPGALVTALTTQTPLVDGVNTFAAPANTTLNPQTNYFITVNEATPPPTGAPGEPFAPGPRAVYELTDSREQSGADGWSIEDKRLYKNHLSQEWGTSDRIFLFISVNGDVHTPNTEQQVEIVPPTVDGTPSVSGAGTDAQWSVGETVGVTVAFSEAVDVGTNGGTPSVGVELGGSSTAARSAAYASGSGTAELVFGYTLVQGDGSHSLMAVTPNSLALNGGTIRSAESQTNAQLAHNGTVVQLGGSTRSTEPEVSFQDVPESHDGATAFTVGVQFSGQPDGLSATRDAASVLEVTGGSVTGARVASKSADPAWEVTVVPDGLGEVTMEVPVRACTEANAVCIGGRSLSRAVETAVPGTPMTARFTQTPSAHDGSNSFELHMEFSHEPENFSYRTVQGALFDIEGGRIERVWRRERGKDRQWGIVVAPDGGGAVSLVARATSDCAAQNAVCDAEGGKFAGDLSLTVPGPASSSLPVVSIVASATPVTEGTAAAFTLSRTGATDAALTVTVSVSESEASVSGTPPTSVTFAAASASATLSVATEDDEVAEDASTVTATVSSGSGYTVSGTSGSADVVVEDDDATPVVTTASPIVVAENATSVATLSATDADTAAADLSWSIPAGAAGGADAAQFALTADGVLSFRAAKDYEAPDDADTDGEYEVTVRVTDGANPVDAALVVRLSDVDDVAPVLSSASVDGAVLTLTFSEALDADSVAPESSFAVTVGGSTRAVDAVAVLGSAVTLTLSAAVETGDTVTVEYTAPDGQGFIRDSQGRKAESFSGQEVTNNTASSGTSRTVPPQAPGAPTSLKVSREESGKLMATWAAPDSGSDPTGYTLQWREAGDGWETQDSVSQAEVKGTSHLITGLTDGVEYAVRVIASRDNSESAPSGEVTATPRETIPPSPLSVSVNGAKLTVTFDEALAEVQAPASTAFAVTVAGNNRGVSAVAVSGSAVILTLATAVAEGDAVTVDYTAPTGESAARLQDLAGNASASFSGLDAGNDTQAADQLTASAHDVPGSHDGSTVFTFELRFSENFYLSYKTLREHAFTVAGGEVTGARRLAPPSNIGWEIQVEPDGDGAATIVLPVTADCTAEGAICTEEGRMLSGGLLLVVPGPNTPATGAPTISGTAQVGETLAADTTGIADDDGLDSVAFYYQWLADDAEINGATAPTYILVAADEGKAIKVQVSLTDDAGNEETLFSAATTAVAAAPPPPNTPATGLPTITGTAQVGETLAADTTGIADDDGVDSAAFTYQWLADDAEINGATAPTYILVAADEGKAIKVQVSLTDDAGNEETLFSAATTAVAAAPPPPNTPATGLSTITGTAQVGETLAADTTGIEDADGLDSAAFTYQWLADDAESNGATAPTYILVAADEGKAIKVQVSFTDDAGNEETLTSTATASVEARPNSPATGAPTISGTVQVRETLTASTSGIADTDGLTNVSYSYQWIRNDGSADTVIQGAAGSSYSLVDADEGKAIKVQVSFTDDADNEETLTSAASASVAGAPEPITVILESNPASHNGTDEFTFQIRFSEHFKLSYKTLRDHAFTVVEGTVKKAQRQVKGSNIGWTITVEPASNAEVEIVLPATTDCDATGAICTADGRKLSNSLDFTVVGPGE